MLDQNLMALSGQGKRIESRMPTYAVVVAGKPVNNVLHLLLAVLSCGFWVPVWLLLGAFTGERRETVSVNEWGQVNVQKSPLGPGRIALIVLAGIWLVLQLFFFGNFIAAMGSDSSTTALGLFV
ncbi:MAG: hypothetical protein WCP30_08920 [Mycobacteriaceae bacterium]